MNLLAYFDASGHHDGSPALSVGGFFGHADDWGAFEYEWQKALDAWGLEAFHMSEFAHSFGSYADWTEEIRRERLGHLLQIILDYSLGSVGVTVPLELYDAIVTGKARAQSGGPFGLAVTATFLEVAALVKSLPEKPHVAYVFEIGDPGYGQVMKVFQDNYKDAASRWDLRLQSILFAGKDEYVPLQAADILAYELHRRYPQERIDPRPAARFPLRVLATQAHSWTFLGEEQLRNAAKILELGLVHSTGTWQKSHLSSR